MTVFNLDSNLFRPCVLTLGRDMEPPILVLAFGALAEKHRLSFGYLLAPPHQDNYQFVASVRVSAQLPVQAERDALDLENSVLDFNVAQLPPLPFALAFLVHDEVTDAEVLGVVLGVQRPVDGAVYGDSEQHQVDMVGAIFVMADLANSVSGGRNVHVSFDGGV